MNLKFLKCLEKLITKEFMVSFFLIFSLLFPWLNSFEIIVFHTQKTFYFYCVFLWLGLFLLFSFFPKIYDLFLNFFFSKMSNTFLFYLEKSYSLLTQFPRTIGVFYGCCFVSFFFLSEMADSKLFFLLNSCLVFLRNFFVLPFLGLVAMLQWILKDFETTIGLEKLNFAFSSDNPNNFNFFEKEVFPHFRLINSNQNYNLEIKRHMFRFIKVSTSNMPNSATLKKVSESTVGATVAGSLGATVFFTGVNTDEGVKQNLALAQQDARRVSESPLTTDLEKDTADILLKRIREAHVDWINDSGPTTAIIGARKLIGEYKQEKLVDNSVLLAKQAATLNQLSSLRSVTKEEKARRVNEFIKEQSISSPLEFYSFGVVEKIKRIFTHFFL